jgi:hypothetical protein
VTDLTQARALAAAARAETLQGLTAQARLADVVEALCDALEAARSLRLARPSEAVDPAVHAPERIAAYLTARGWSPCDRFGPHWTSDEHPDMILHAHRIATAADYLKRTGLLVSDLAELGGCGELQVLSDIEASAP